MDFLKKSKSLTQREIAARMEETEQELSGKLSLTSQRGITDEYVDKFSKEFGLPFTVGAGGEGVTSDLLEKLLKAMLASQDQQTMMMRDINRLVERVEELSSQRAQEQAERTGP